MGSTKVKVIDDTLKVEPSQSAEKVEDKVAETKASSNKADVKQKPKKGKIRARSKKYQEAVERIERSKFYPVGEAVELAKQVSYSKFPGSLEVHINTNVKNLRGLVSLPHLSGKQVRILVFGPASNSEIMESVVYGDDGKIADIEKGKIDFDVLVATPSWMPKLSRSAKILGPRGLMPNPKNGTVTDNVEKAVAELKSGKVEYRTEPNLSVMHLRLGALAQPAEELTANIKTLFSALGKSKVRQMVLAPTMGPAVKVDLGTL